MQKQIRLLVENLFDELYDIDQETNSEIDLADQVYQYKLGDIYYEYKKPTAICCGDAEDFHDKNPRFAILDYHSTFKCAWANSNRAFKKLKSYHYTNFKVSTKEQIKFIDENGYENTQIIKNKYDLYKFPAFQECFSYIDVTSNHECYLPAINELAIFFVNRHILDNVKKRFDKNDIFRHYCSYWTSTQIENKFALTLEPNMHEKQAFIHSEEKSNPYSYVWPFVKII